VEAFVERRRPDQVGEDDGDDLACAGVLGRAGDERCAAGVAELGLGSGLTPTRRAARCERPPATVAEPCTRPVRCPTLRTVHGDRASTPGRLRCFTFRASDTTRAGAWPQPADDRERAVCRLIVNQETHGDENLLVMARRSLVFQLSTPPLIAKALREGGRV